MIKSEEEEDQNGKRQYITYVTDGLPRPRILYKRMVNRKIIKPMVVNKKEGDTSIGELNRPILKKLRGILKEIIPLMVTCIVTNFDVYRVLIVDESSYDILYSNIFENL